MWSQGPRRFICTHTVHAPLFALGPGPTHQGWLSHGGCVPMWEAMCVHTVSTCVPLVHAWFLQRACFFLSKGQNHKEELWKSEIPPSSRLNVIGLFKNNTHTGCMLLLGSDLRWSQKRGLNSGEGVPQVPGPLSGVIEWPGPLWIPSPHTVLPPIPMAHCAVLDFPKSPPLHHVPFLFLINPPTHLPFLTSQ